MKLIGPVVFFLAAMAQAASAVEADAEAAAPQLDIGNVLSTFGPAIKKGK